MVKRRRVNVSFTEGDFTMLTDMSSQAGQSYPQLLHDALVLYRWWREHRRQGSRILVETAAGERREVLIGL
jgi:hypothetical protein